MTTIVIGGVTYTASGWHDPVSGLTYTNGAGGGGTGGVADTIWTDDSGTFFLVRDTGTTITYVTVAGAPYTPTTNIRPHSTTPSLQNVNTPNLTGAASLAAAASSLAIAVGPVATVGVQIAGTGAGFTLQPQASMDGGTTWINVGVIAAGSGATSSPVSTITANGNWEFSAGGYTSFRLLNTVAASSGTVSATLSATAAQKFIRSAGIGDQADTAATTDTGTFSLIGLIKRLLTKTNPQAAPYTGQQKATGTAAALPAAALLNGLVVTASALNIGSIMVGPAGVTATNDGTGNGYALLPGQSASFACSNANQVYIIGITGYASTDFVSVMGN